MESMRRTPVDDLLGFRFAPRIRDLADKRIYVLEKGSAYPAFAGLVGGMLSVRLIAISLERDPAVAVVVVMLIRVRIAKADDQLQLCRADNG